MSVFNNLFLYDVYFLLEPLKFCHHIYPPSSRAYVLWNQMQHQENTMPYQ